MWFIPFIVAATAATAATGVAIHNNDRADDERSRRRREQKDFKRSLREHDLRTHRLEESTRELESLAALIVADVTTDDQPRH